MGACTFHVVATGSTPEDAFRRAGNEDRYENGHDPYSGGIGMKRRFILLRDTHADVLRLAERAIARARARSPWLVEQFQRVEARLRAAPEAGPAVLARALIDLQDERVDDPWGPAGCLVLSEPAPGRPLTQDEACAAARLKWGVDVTVEACPDNGSAVATVIRVTRPGGSQERAAVASAHGPSLEAARGALFDAPGRYLFFGWAKE